ELMDIVGTGGDGLGTFNISTAAALVVASCGVPVAKHGNRAVTGSVGSADMLEALGVNIQLRPDEARRLLDNAGITFLFAPNFHPILKQVGPLRRSIGIATIFNFLGPLLNPYPLAFQVLGIADASLQEAVAGSLNDQGRKRALVVCAANGMDEISPSCKTRVHDVGIAGDKIYDIDPAELGFAHYQLDSIKGGNAQTNAMIIHGVLAGETGPYRDTVLLNAGAALMAAGRGKDIAEGIQLAAEAIDSGKAHNTLQAMISCSRDGVLGC
ncbi:MAG: anthranilate phosphoribosyltransferase, partial [Syntrophomonadaceae bacterium]|nr:anthranilate phosphoribosyltransferase [Syntrophomonadaceae bacterium]